jgi:hypothetical protein
MHVRQMNIESQNWKVETGKWKLESGPVDNLEDPSRIDGFPSNSRNEWRTQAPAG